MINHAPSMSLLTSPVPSGEVPAQSAATDTSCSQGEPMSQLNNMIRLYLLRQKTLILIK